MGEDIFPNALSGTGKDARVVNVDVPGISAAGNAKTTFLVYGNRNDSDDALGASGSRRSIGFSVNGMPFPDPSYPPDRLSYTFDNYWYTPERMFASDDYAITRWLGEVRLTQYNIPDNVFTAENLLDLHPELVERSGLPAGDSKHINLKDVVYVLQPPTNYTWGMTIAFNRDTSTSGTIWYTTALIKPYILQSDLEAAVENVPSSARAGEAVTVDFSVMSTFPDSITTDYDFSINGAAEPRQTLVTLGNGSVPSQQTFTMPDSGVTLVYTVNPTQLLPQESKFDNNTVTVTIANVPDITATSSDIEIDYNVLERNINFNPGESQAHLTLPQGNWDGNATGRLEVDNRTASIYNNFTVENNPDVDEPATDITRDPIVHTVLRRKDFGDDPLSRVYGATNAKTGEVFEHGSVSRPYRWYHGNPDCTGHTNTTTAAFNGVTNTKNITALVYNGKAAITPPTFKKQIDGASALTEKLWWVSDPIPLDVIRLMYTQEEDDTLDNETNVDGRYVRSFIEQDEADINFSVPGNISAGYQTDREKARNRDYTLDSNDKAVFASDLNQKSVDYPIRSGYFFNPTGEYSFAVKTEIYKDTPDDTAEHKNIIDAIIAAFRYESDLVYINPSRQAVSIDGESLSKTGTAYAGSTASATTELHPLFDIRVDRNYNKDNAEELLHDYTEAGTDERFKPVLEGYSQSSSGDSKTNYKYVEFVNNAEKVYKITETTTVTITVNPDNQKVYTHAQMKNGGYGVRAYIDSVDLAPLTYGQLGTLARVNLDGIAVSVVGSMYDDER
ncbi:hypothetical protein AGMMS49975_02220 [Clostridia bacterium]|nr:hypothetical protein AGMMS49975_02220 [Clostridia bacterium]